MIKPKYHVFVCTSCRINGVQKGFCHSKDSVDLVQRLMDEIEERDLHGQVMITNTGCFGICDKGPIMAVYPEGTWYGNVTKADIERIVEQHFENDEKVEELVI
ncbi:MAG TPA: 2Fe-2S ferredoxin [Syntrophomonas sp.]|nr:2Fe-2S ferredoxin [Syntrophomonas sp.]